MPNKYKFRKLHMHRGVVLLIAVVILASALAIALGIFSIYSGELALSEDMRESYKAFYHANTGIECLLFYDKYPSGSNPVLDYSFFQPPLWYSIDPPSPNTQTIYCGGRPWTIERVRAEETNDKWTREYKVVGGMPSLCITDAKITQIDVDDPADPDPSKIMINTTIDVLGTNFIPGSSECSGGKTQVQRGIRAVYQRAPVFIE